MKLSLIEIFHLISLEEAAAWGGISARHMSTLVSKMEAPQPWLVGRSNAYHEKQIMIWALEYRLGKIRRRLSKSNLSAQERENQRHKLQNEWVVIKSKLLRSQNGPAVLRDVILKNLGYSRNMIDHITKHVNCDEPNIDIIEKRLGVGLDWRVRGKDTTDTLCPQTYNYPESDFNKDSNETN